MKPVDKSPITHPQKGDLHEQSLKYIPLVQKAYPNLDFNTVDCIAKYCVVYAKGTSMKSVRQAINDYQEVFDTDLQ